MGLLDSSNSDKPFLGRDMGSSSGLSDYSKQKIEAETQRIIEFCYNRAVNILIYNKENLKNMSDLLMNKTTIGKTELDNFDIKFKK